MNLECAETFKEDEPSTSYAQQSTSYTNFALHKGRVVLQNVDANASFTRSKETDNLLNNQQRYAVYNKIDRHIHTNQKVLLNLFKQEEDLTSNYHYFTAVQEHITPYHREQAVDWIFDVAKEEGCDGDVFLLAVSLIDRFLSVQNIFKGDIQMLAGVCLFLASKMKAAVPLNAEKISYYTDDSCKVEDILSWELLVVSQLDWELSSPTAFDFFERLVARHEQIDTLKANFQEVVHRIQKSHKLATLYPSMQCSLAILYTAQFLSSNVELSQIIQKLVLEVFQLQVPLLQSYFGQVDSCLLPVPIYPAPAPVEATSPTAPPCSTEHLSPPTEVEELAFDNFTVESANTSFLEDSGIFVDTLKAPEVTTPTTPLNDSGFCSNVNSPQSSGKKRTSKGWDEEDFTPPKVARYEEV